MSKIRLYYSFKCKTKRRWVWTRPGPLEYHQERSSKALLDAGTGVDPADGAFKRPPRRIPCQPVAHPEMGLGSRNNLRAGTCGVLRLGNPDRQDLASSL